MKSLLCLGTTVAAIFLLATRANAADPYFFSDYNYIDANDRSLSGFDAGLGLAFGEHFGIEAGYIHASGPGGSANGGSLDLAYHFPLGQSRFSLFATAGGEYADAQSDGWGVRAGGGIEYSPIKDFAIRAGARYQSAIDDGVIANVGVIIRL